MKREDAYMVRPWAMANEPQSIGEILRGGADRGSLSRKRLAALRRAVAGAKDTADEAASPLTPEATPATPPYRSLSTGRSSDKQISSSERCAWRAWPLAVWR